MGIYFNIFLEFDHCRFHDTVQHTISNFGKGYVCVVDANVITIAQKDLEYRGIVNAALTNTCDGSSVALMASIIHKKDLRILSGPDLFKFYIEKPFKHLILGSTDEVFEKVHDKLNENGLSGDCVSFLSLPFVEVEGFDYLYLAKEINLINPDMIWVSLGAPKQELFMSRLLPLIDKGMMFGIGAALNFYIGEIPVPRVTIGRLKLIWINRLFHEPRKQFRRVFSYIKIMPQLYFLEKKKASLNNTVNVKIDNS